MTDRTGLGELDLAILAACEAAGAGNGEPMAKSSRVLDRLHDATAIGPDNAYEPLCVMARPGTLHVPLIRFLGNVGTLDDPPASPRYTECGLTVAGAAALASERGHLGPLPLGLINGDIHVGGRHPAFGPNRMLDAISAVAANPGLVDSAIIQLVGPVRFPSGCQVSVDMAALAAGESCEMALAPSIDVTEHSILMTRFPPHGSPERISIVLSEQIGAESGIRAVRNATTKHNGGRVEVDLVPGVDRGAIVDRLARHWQVRRIYVVQLVVPLADEIRRIAVGPDHNGGLQMIEDGIVRFP